MGFRFLLDLGLHVADVTVELTEAPAARDVDGAAPLVTSEGRWAVTWAGNLDAARAAGASHTGLVMLCHSLFNVSGIKEAESQLVKLNCQLCTHAEWPADSDLSAPPRLAAGHILGIPGQRAFALFLKLGSY